MPKTPSYRRRRDYPVQALVTLQDSVTRQRRDYYLGEHGSAESREQYHRLIARWEACGRRLPEPVIEPGILGSRAGRTIADVIQAYWSWAENYYQANHADTLKAVLRLLRRYYGTTPASEFGPPSAPWRSSAAGGDPSLPLSRRFRSGLCARAVTPSEPRPGGRGRVLSPGDMARRCR